MHPPLVRAEIARISEIPDDDERTIGGETIGDRPADALGGARDDDGLACVTAHRCSVLTGPCIRRRG